MTLGLRKVYKLFFSLFSAREFSADVEVDQSIAEKFSGYLIAFKYKNYVNENTFILTYPKTYKRHSNYMELRGLFEFRKSITES